MITAPHPWGLSDNNNAQFGYYNHSSFSCDLTHSKTIYKTSGQPNTYVQALVGTNIFTINTFCCSSSTLPRRYRRSRFRCETYKPLPFLIGLYTKPWSLKWFVSPHRLLCQNLAAFSNRVF